MTKYLPALKEINRHLATFNSFLKDEYQISLLDEREIDNNDYILNLNGKIWDEFRFPRNCTVGGIYFYLGVSETNPDTIGIYIGKASLQSTIGRRLWTHFRNAFDDKGKVYKYDYDGEKFRIEAITLIPFEQTGMTCLAPAVEEFLIDRVKKNDTLKLINVQGNR